MKQLYQDLLKNLGDQGNWPAENPEEIILGAILVQNTRWENVLLSINNLRQVLDGDFKKILDLEPETLQDLIRPTGFYKNKSKSILKVFSWLDQHAYNYGEIEDNYGKNLRDELLGLFGIGQETADVLLLYVFDQLVFIADKYAQKLFSSLTRKEFSDYSSLHQAVELEGFSLSEAQQFHILILEFGKIYFARGASFEESFLFGATFDLT
ncbi:HhH-GPD family protein [Streptococcus sobrinus DSM 20742 = ATCC 33478]|nr:HhH-GPD family protein [Streptococcus sobrinus DSM 20742 = ATCC 33478]